jgi:hypothetical protein
MTTIRQLQTSLPWTVHYHRDFRSNPQSHKDFGHALLHVFKAAGKLASLVNDAEHGGCEFTAEETDRYIADLVVCALRMANTCPGRTIDLESAVVDRIAKKNAAEEAGVPQGAAPPPSVVHEGGVVRISVTTRIRQGWICRNANCGGVQETWNDSGWICSTCRAASEIT